MYSGASWVSGAGFISAIKSEDTVALVASG